MKPFRFDLSHFRVLFTYSVQVVQRKKVIKRMVRQVVTKHHDEELAKEKREAEEKLKKRIAKEAKMKKKEEKRQYGQFPFRIYF